MAVILAIDDDQNIHKLLDAQLKSFGYKLISAYRSEAGIEMAKNGNPDLILLDIMLPSADGFQTLRILRFNQATKEIPIIMLTSKSSVTDVASAMKSGAADYIVKPYDKNTLKKKIDTAIQYSRMKRSEDIAEKSEHINVSREGGRTVITFMTPLGNSRIIDDLKMIFNKGFLNLTIKDKVILDLRQLTELEETSFPLLSAIFNMFGSKDVYVVAGRHYGTIVGGMETKDTVHLYISHGDMEMELDSQKK